MVLSTLPFLKLIAPFSFILIQRLDHLTLLLRYSVTNVCQLQLYVLGKGLKVLFKYSVIVVHFLVCLLLTPTLSSTPKPAKGSD